VYPCDALFVRGTISTEYCTTILYRSPTGSVWRFIHSQYRTKIRSTYSTTTELRPAVQHFTPNSLDVVHVGCRYLSFCESPLVYSIIQFSPVRRASCEYYSLVHILPGQIYSYTGSIKWVTLNLYHPRKNGGVSCTNMAS
jgi:hypothetical protein